jgi:hypothetical protein
VALVVVACTPVTSPMPAASGTGAPSALATPSPAGSTATPAASLDRAAAWQADLALIVPGIERIHPDPFRGTPRADLEAAVADLSARAATLTDDQLMVGVLEVAAMVSANACDGHTGGFIWGTGTYPLDSLPLRLWLFGEELVIVDELGSDGLVGARIDAIEGRPIADVLTTLDPVIPRDNEQTVRLLTPRYLLIPQVLRGLGLADDGPITVGVSRDGVPSEIEIEPVPMADYNAWAGPYGLHLPADPDVRYLARIDEALWWERLRKGPLYIQYNRVEFMPAAMADLREAATAPDVNRVILDIRHNFGGEVPALDAMVAIFEDPAVDVPGELFLITGRNTWSAGVMLTARLEARTSVIIIGEPTAGCPTFYGDVVQLPLPNSGLVLLVTEMLEVGVDPDDTRPNIPLDAEAELTLEEWLDGIDPALELLEVDAA